MKCFLKVLYMMILLTLTISIKNLTGYSSTMRLMVYLKSKEESSKCSFKTFPSTLKSPLPLP